MVLRFNDSNNKAMYLYKLKAGNLFLLQSNRYPELHSVLHTYSFMLHNDLNMILKIHSSPKRIHSISEKNCS